MPTSTPPVCLAAYTAAGISGSNPLETGLESWKLAKGLYIIPLLFCYSPLLFEGSTWQVVETAIMGLGGLYFFAVFFEGYNLRSINWPFRLGYFAAAVLLVWPHLYTHAMGVALVAALALVEVKIFAPGPDPVPVRA